MVFRSARSVQQRRCLAAGAHAILILSGALLLPSAPALADWSSTSSAQLILRVDPGQGTANAVGASYAVQGNGLGGTPVLNTGAAPANGLSLQPIAAGASFQLNMSVKPADKVVTVSPDGPLPAYSEVSIQQPGAAGSLAGEVSSPTTGAATAGGPGTSATLTQSNTFSVF